MKEIAIATGILNPENETVTIVSASSYSGFTGKSHNIPEIIYLNRYSNGSYILKTISDKIVTSTILINSNKIFK